MKKTMIEEALNEKNKKHKKLKFDDKMNNILNSSQNVDEKLKEIEKMISRK